MLKNEKFRSGGFVFNYNSDLSGEFIIVNNNDSAIISLPGETILDFMATYIKREKINRLEKASSKEILEEVINND